MSSSSESSNRGECRNRIFVSCTHVEFPVTRFIARVALVVREYDEAIEFFTGKLGFALIEDTHIPNEDNRWVLVAPADSRGTAILLARASTEDQKRAIGNQTGGRVFLFLYTDDFWRDYERMKSSGVCFVRPPREERYGTVAVFEDLYGNLWDLLEPADESSLTAV